MLNNLSKKLANWRDIHEAATPGTWERPLNTRFRATVYAPLPDDEPSEWVDRKTPNGEPERVRIVSVPIWSDGKFLRQRSGKDLSAIVHEHNTYESLLNVVEDVVELVKGPHPYTGQEAARLLKELHDSLSRNLNSDQAVEAEEPLCGDYPAPCNCDDPETHNGH